jgi:hypothetical protein
MIISLFFALEIEAIPIDTPEVNYTGEGTFAIKCPDGWGYRTFRGDNGLIAVLWPAESTFNAAGTAIFVFMQNSGRPLPEIPCNINLFTEKCTKANFHFVSKQDINDPTKSLNEKYFTGKCGKTMILFEEIIREYTLIFAFISDGYVTKNQLADVKEAVANYRVELEEYIKMIDSLNNEEAESKSDTKETESDT